MFKETEEGQTHSFDDGCIPPHEKPEQLPERESINHTEWVTTAIRGVVLEMMTLVTAPLQNHCQREWEKEFDEKYCLTLFGSGIGDPIFPHDVSPNEIKAFISQVEQTAKQQGREEERKASDAFLEIAENSTPEQRAIMLKWWEEVKLAQLGVTNQESSK